MARLNEVAEVVRGVTFNKSQSTNEPSTDRIPVLRAGNISGSLDLSNNLIWIPRSLVSDKQLLKKNDIVMCMSSGSSKIVGKSAILDHDWDGTFGAFLAVIRTYTAKCLPEYIAYFLQSDGFRKWTESSSGANIKNIRKSELASFQIPIPPLAEQRRIVDILNRADSIRRLRKQAINTARQLIPALFIDMFGDPATNPQGWLVVDLGELITSGPQNGLYKPASCYGEGVPILRIDGFYDGVVTDYANLRRLNVTKEELEKYRLNQNDIVINRVNSPDYLGKSALIQGAPEETVFESNMMRFAVDGGRIEPRYLIFHLQLAAIKNQILAKAKHAINQSSINQSDVKSLRLILPPMELQTEFVNRVIEIRSITAQQNNSLLKAEMTFRSLLNTMFQAGSAEWPSSSAQESVRSKTNA